MTDNVETSGGKSEPPDAKSEDVPAPDERTASRKAESFFSPPRVRLATLMAWMLIAGGAAGWAKYHLDIAAEERAVLDELSAAGCTVDATKSFRPAEEDGLYGPRFWYEPPFLERVRKIDLGGGEPPADLLVRAASLPGLDRYEWFAGYRFDYGAASVSEVLGLPPLEPPQESLTEDDFPPESPTGEPLSGEETERVLQVVRESWARSREPTDRLVSAVRVSEFSQWSGGQESYEARILQASDGALRLSQSQEIGPIDFEAPDRRTIVARNERGDWFPFLRFPVEPVGLRRSDDELERLSNPLRFVSASTLDGDAEVRRIENGRYRIDFAPNVVRYDYGDELQETTYETAVVVSEADEWLPVAVRRFETERHAQRTGTELDREAFRYAVVDGRRVLVERLHFHETGRGYRKEERRRFAWDFDPQFDETTFDPRRLVGPGFAPPGTYPFRWYWIPFAAGIVWLACLFLQRARERLFNLRVSAKDAVPADRPAPELDEPAAPL